MMLPMSVRCDTCGNFMYIGTKFNMRKETCNDEEYLGIKIFRFYFKCTRCYAEVTMKTDPKNHDYVCEHGASRNYEPWRDIQHAETVLRAKRQLEDSDAMKSLENRTYDSKREMDVLDALEEVRQMNRRLAKVNHEELLLKTLAKYEDKEEEAATEQACKESFDKHKERLKYKRINEDEPYEDGDNFDKHIGFKFIADPFELLKKLEKGEDVIESESSESEAEDGIKKPNEEEAKKRMELKRKRPETQSEEKFDNILMFKKPQTSKLTSLMKKVKPDEKKA